MVEPNGSDERMAMVEAMGLEIARSSDIVRMVFMMDINDYLQAHPDIVPAFKFFSDLEEKIREALHFIERDESDVANGCKEDAKHLVDYLTYAHRKSGHILSEMVYDRIPKRRPLAT